MRVRASQRLGFLRSSQGGQGHSSLMTARPLWTLPCTILQGHLEAPLLVYLLESPEWGVPEEVWMAARERGVWLPGFGQHGRSLEVVRHCRSQAQPCLPCANLRLFGQDASLPAPRRLMAFRHALVTANAQNLRRLGKALQAVLRDHCDERERRVFGHHGGTSLLLSRSAFAFATLQLRWGATAEATMARHVDGGPSLLHLALSLAGQRTVSCEFISSAGDGRVETCDLVLGPGDAYLSSPACCHHSVAYSAQLQAEAPPAGLPGGYVTADAVPLGSQPLPSTIVIQFRSDLLRRRAKPQDFPQSNRMLAECLAPVVARFLAVNPLRLPRLEDVRAAEAQLGPPRGKEAPVKGPATSSGAGGPVWPVLKRRRLWPMGSLKQG